MRIWQKIYFVTLLLFLLALNAGLFFAARFLFSYNLTQEKKKAETDCYFLCQNLEHDLSILERNGRYRDSVVKLLLESYQNLYQTHIIFLYLYINSHKSYKPLFYAACRTLPCRTALYNIT